MRRSLASFVAVCVIAAAGVALGESAAIAADAAAQADGSKSAMQTTIENRFLTVNYDGAAGTFSVVDKATGLVFLKDGRQSRVVADAGPAHTSSFDRGQHFRSRGKVLNVPTTNHGQFSLYLYDDLPFVFMAGRLSNPGKEPLDVHKVVPATFTLDLGKPADALRTMGTGGLTSPDKNPGSYLFLTLADPATRRGVVAGWLTNDRGAGVLFSSVQHGKVEFRPQIDYGRLRIPGSDGGAKATVASAQLETLAIGVFDDARIGQERFADAMAKHYQIKLRPQAAGYCTWYSDAHGGAGDEKSIVELAKFVAKELKPFGFSFVQIDDQWQDGGEYNGPRRGFDRVRPNGPYAHGMQPVARQLQELDLTTGLWFMPFARNHQDPEYKDRQHWFMKRADGRPYETAWGGTSLDLTQPEVQSHLTRLVRTVYSWGVRYFKMDGLWTGSATEQIYVNDGYRDDDVGNNAPFHDPTKTNVEVYRDGLKLLRNAAGPDVFFSGCNVSQNMRTLGGSIGLVDSMRIGPDNGQGWANYEKEIAKNECGSIITGPVRGSRLYFLHGRVWWNDPDPSYVRASIPMNHARLITSWVALSGAFYLNSDWLPGLPSERLDIVKRTIPAHDATARPVDYFESILPSIWLVTDARQSVRRDVLGLFNWESKSRAIGCDAGRAGLDPAAAYHAFDFWANAPVASFGGAFKIDVPAESCRVIAVRAAAGHPVLVSTSRHVTQGMVDVRDEAWNDSTRELSGASLVVGNDPYEIRIAGLNDGQARRVAATSVSAEDQAAGVRIEARPAKSGEDGWLRVGISSKDSRRVRWSVRFAAL
jgi:hypothetical protein